MRDATVARRIVDEQTRGKRWKAILCATPSAWHTDRESLLYFAVRAVVQSLLCNQRAIVRPRGVTIALNWSKRSCEHPRLISWVIRPRIRRCRLRRGNSCESSFFVHAIVASEYFCCLSIYYCQIVEREWTIILVEKLVFNYKTKQLNKGQKNEHM